MAMEPEAPEPEETPEPTPEPTAEPTPEPTPEPSYVYQNGTFSGTADGFEGAITVSVTVQDDVITAISVVSTVDDEPYLTLGKEIISRILSAQSTDVDTVSGATFSSTGIKNAVKSALESAKS